MKITEGFTWYVPTWYGDIRLRTVGKTTVVEVCELTRCELAAIQDLRKHATKFRIGGSWSKDADWEAIPKEAFEVGSKKAATVTLDTTIDRVESFLRKKLRGPAASVSIAITQDGSLYEIKAPDKENETRAVQPYREPAPGPEPVQAELVAAVTVRKPVLGCPAPDFVKAHERATHVLRQFLSNEQISDFEKHQRFLTIGGRTGHRYMITSRHATDELRSTSFRSVYDIDDSRAMCVHDWGVPAPEEMLTMHLMLSMPDWENYIRGIPDHPGQLLHNRPQGRPLLPPPPPERVYDPDGVRLIPTTLRS